MKTRSKQIHIFEFNDEEIKLLDSTLRKINGILDDKEIDLTDYEQNIIDDIIDGCDEILHP